MFLRHGDPRFNLKRILICVCKGPKSSISQEIIKISFQIIVFEWYIVLIAAN